MHGARGRNHELCARLSSVRLQAYMTRKGGRGLLTALYGHLAHTDERAHRDGVFAGDLVCSVSEVRLRNTRKRAPNAGFRLENSTLLWSEPFGTRILRRLVSSP
jgi:hypothetical protein